jgi:molybdopterin synthase sulfur carrier subunit
MKITVIAFGVASEIFKGSSVDVELNNIANAGDLKLALENKYPALTKIGSYFIAVNNEYAEEQTPITIYDEVAVIPPVSGG